jgi:hypothetical protein
MLTEPSGSDALSALELLGLLAASLLQVLLLCCLGATAKPDAK